MSELSMGTIVSWNAPKEVSYADLQTAMLDAGIDVKFAKEMLPRNAFSRAAKDLSDARVIRKVDESDDEVKFQFTKEYLLNSQYQYELECNLWLNKSTGSVRSDNAELADVAEKLVIEHQAKRNSSDITRLIQKLFDEQKGDLISIRSNGGVYFVPASHTELVDQIERLLVAIGGSLPRFKIHFGDTGTQTSVAQAFTDHLLDLVDQFKMSCKDITSETSLTIIDRRAGVVKELRDKLQAHQALLAGYAEGIATEIDNAENEIARRFMDAPEPPAPPVAPMAPELATV